MAHGISENQLGASSGLYNALIGADAFYKVDYTALNSSGAAGGAFLALNSEANTLTVVATGTGVEAGVVHPQHIHGFEADGAGNVQDSQSPTLAQDTDGDGIVEVAEGRDTYGPIQLALTDPAGGEVTNFPTPDDTSFVQATTYDLSALDAGAMNSDGEGATLSDVLTAANLDQREMVLHGMTLDGSRGAGTDGQANGEAGFKAVLPIASGEIQRVDTERAMADLVDGRISVSNDVVAFDIGGSAGAAYRIFDSALDRTPDQSGLSFYTNQLDGGADLADVGSSLLNSDEFTSSFGSVGDLSNDAYIDLLYTNVLGREADGDGKEFYVGQLEEGQSRGQVLASFSESDEHQATLVGQTEGGVLLNDGVMA